MNPEIYWLTMTALMTALFWVPYVLNRFVEMGIPQAVFNPDADTTPQSPWAKRMVNAHKNAVENLVVFAALAIAVEVSGSSSALTETAVMLYFFARLAHFIVYSLGIPGLRTIAFIIGFVCQLLLGLSVLGFL